MTAPLDLAELRRYAHANSLGATIAIDPVKVLALVEAVEAAQSHAEDCCRTDIDWRESMRTHDGLCKALACFSFGEPAA